MPFTEKPPKPLPPTIRRFDEKGNPTKELLDYEKKLEQYLTRLAAAIT
jgi:hypothetical protein